ncbi:MAG: tetraacyldisaccharide 4'-kinase [Bryobacterales bacterium]|nr:tetraacyldisaccharide 4'-kinase [Bryobacteraceae bacterium]MDW8130478.1 tetraacyldisaccharide 4'-kinase [Bryobacterales bacterium]
MLIYRLLAAAALPFAAVYLLCRLLRDPRYRKGWEERLGWLPAAFRQTAPGSIWLHAVSVGEVLSAVELVRRLRERLPYAPLFVSVTTVAGRELAERRLAGLAQGIFYAPVDYCFAVRRVLRTLRPRVLIVLETEIWPNLWREGRRAGCALLVVNGRISAHALPRYRRLQWFFQPLLALPHAILAQDDASHRRYLELGAPPDRTVVAGNLKFDFDARKLRVPEEIENFLRRVNPSAVWIAASTMPPAEPGDPDEDEAVLAAFQRLAPSLPGLLLILAPRRPERFEQTAQRLREAGVAFLRRSHLAAAETLALPGVLLLDSIGELASLFRLADVVFMGGTLAQRGGHNILEPGAFARAIVTGPHLENFPAIAEEFRRRQALCEIGSAAELAPAVARLLADAQLRSELGQRALEAARAQQGAAERAASEILLRYCRARPRLLRAWPWQACLWLLSRLWLAGGAARRRWQQARRVKLAAPVISVGALAMGGSGKTSFTLWLARELARLGQRPAVLLRGYRRSHREPMALAPGERADVAATGDEAQLHLRAGVAAVGVGADRARTGRILLERFHPDLFLLDDGFQHARLARDLDIVLVDAFDPGDRVFPVGRLREPPTALSRAHIVVISHAEALPDTGALEQWIRRFNRRAPVFRARLRARAWMPASGGTPIPVSAPPFARPAAFCALGRPAAFWRMLEALGVEPVWRREFPDHHRYRPAELLTLAQLARASGADALLTTEKDLMNLPEGWPQWAGDLPVYWLHVEVEVDGAAQLLKSVLSCVAPRA